MNDKTRNELAAAGDTKCLIETARGACQLRAGHSVKCWAPDPAVARLKDEHRTTDSGQTLFDGEMTHALWQCSCGAVLTGSGAAGEHKRVALRNIRREIRAKRA